MEKKIESMRRFGRITMWCPLIISMVLGILAILVSILGTTNPFFYTFANVPELYALETGGPFGGIKMAAIFIVIGFGFTVAGAILTCLAELMDGYVEEVEENTEEIEETKSEPLSVEAPQEEKTQKKTAEPVSKETNDKPEETEKDEQDEEKEMDIDYSEMRHAYDDIEIPVVETSEEEPTSATTETEDEPEKAEEPTEEVEEPVGAEGKGEKPEEPVEDAEEADEDGQYICPTFKAVYEKLPSGYQIKKGDMKRDPEIKGMLHFRIGNHYFKTTASGDIYDDEPWD